MNRFIFCLIICLLTPLTGICQVKNNTKIFINPASDENGATVGKVICRTDRFINTGSGTLVGPDLVLTCAHTISSKNIEFTLRDKTYLGKLIALDIDTDRALLRLKDKLNLKFKKIRTTPPEQNSKFKSYGYGDSFGYHSGVYKDGMFYAKAIYGDSGGPILDENGDIIDVICSVADETENSPANIYGHGYKDLIDWFNKYKNYNGSDPIITD